VGVTWLMHPDVVEDGYRLTRHLKTPQIEGYREKPAVAGVGQVSRGQVAGEGTALEHGAHLTRLCRCFTDFLGQHLNKTELLPDDAGVMKAVILDRIAKGEALLLVDGLDEISSQRVRVTFCQELERTAARYPAAPIVVTSRIVGYRDMHPTEWALDSSTVS